MATIGQSLLKEANLEETDLGVELSGLLSQLQDATPDLIKDISASLLSFIQMNAAPEPMDFGGFDQPVASTSLAARKKKKTVPEAETPPLPEKLSGLPRLWRDNPVAVIATNRCGCPVYSDRFRVWSHCRLKFFQTNHSR